VLYTEATKIYVKAYTQASVYNVLALSDPKHGYKDRHTIEYLCLSSSLNLNPVKRFFVKMNKTV